MRLLAAAFGTAALAIFAPAVADASVYCVGTSGADCSYGYAGTGDALQQALADADNTYNLSAPTDTVRIGAGTYKRTNGADFTTSGGDITVEGAGQSTILTTDAASNRTVLHNTGASGGTVRNLRVDLAGTAFGVVGFHNVSDLRVSGPGTARVGVSATSGTRFSRLLIDPATINGAGVMAYGNVTIEDVAVRMRKANVNAVVQGVSLDTDLTPGTYNSTVRHVTVFGDGGTYSTGVEVLAIGDAAGARTLNATVRDSVLRNLAHPIDRFAITNTTGNPGTANLTYRYSSFDATKDTVTGPGSTTPGPGNLPDPDPLFAPDMSLSAGSPLIDAGDPAAPEAGDSPTDLAGNPRIIGPRRDIGAFEAPLGAPPAGPVGPGSTTPGATVASAGALAVSPNVFRAAAHGPSVLAARRAQVGAVVSYTLNIDASVAFTVVRPLPGRRVRKGKRVRCVKLTAKNRRARRCTRSKALGTFTQAGHAGLNRFRFEGRLNGRKLKPGRYVLVAQPTAGGAAGPLVRAPFRIVK